MTYDITIRVEAESLISALAASVAGDAGGVILKAERVGGSSNWSLAEVGTEMRAKLAKLTDGIKRTAADPPAPKATRAQIKASIQPDYLVSFEDGKQYRTLRRHLKARYGLTFEQYREKWGLPDDYPANVWQQK